MAVTAKAEQGEDEGDVADAVEHVLTPEVRQVGSCTAAAQVAPNPAREDLDHI